MKIFAAVLLVVAVVSAAPSDQAQPQQDIARTAKDLQSIAHMAVVETISPLHVGIAMLVQKIDVLQNAASKQQIDLPEINIPKVDLSSVFTCQQSKVVPKFSVAFQYLAEKSTDMQAHQQQAPRLSSGLDKVILMLNQNDIDNDALQSVATKLNQFLGSYASILSDAVNAICNAGQIQPTSDMESMLSVFY